MIPNIGDVIIYMSTPRMRFEAIRKEPGMGWNAGRVQVFCYKFGEDGRLERDWEAWFMFPTQLDHVKIERAYCGEQMDMFEAVA